MSMSLLYYRNGQKKKKKKKPETMLNNQPIKREQILRKKRRGRNLIGNQLLFFYLFFYLAEKQVSLYKMESNKDEALKCLAIAKKSLELGDHIKALRFTEKSIRLFPTSQGEQLLSIVQKQNAMPRKAPASAPAKTPTKKAATPEPAQERKYTVEQHRAVKTMLAYGKDYYKILSVDKSATDNEIKKAYRKVRFCFTSIQ